MSLDLLGCRHEVSRPSNSSVNRGVVMQERRAYMMKTDVEGEYYAVKVVFFGELTAVGRYNSVLFYCGHSDGVVFRKGNKKGASTTRRYAGVYLRLYESGGGIVCGDYPVAMKICVCFICLVLRQHWQRHWQPYRLRGS